MGSKEFQPSGDSSVVRIPVESQGQLKMESVTLQGISNYETLGGDLIEFILYPKIENKSIRGEKPRFKFTRSASGEYLAKDDLSLQAALLYYHFQQLKAQDESFGLGGLLEYPRKVALAIDRGFKLKNNAYYNSEIDTFVFVPFTGETLPLMANAGVLAHEHFHALFFKLLGVETLGLVGAQLTESFESLHLSDFNIGLIKAEQEAVIDLSIDERAAYHGLVLRGINEGLADVWAWIYTGNPDFLALSLPREREGRTLEKVTQGDLTLESVIELKQEVLATRESDPSLRKKYLNVIAYRLGTQLARVLKVESHQFAKTNELKDKESRAVLGKAIVRALPLLKDQVIALKEGEYLDPQMIVKMVKDEMKSEMKP